ncbi:MAG: response regulator transcription factor [Bacteroidales bacterium]
MDKNNMPNILLVEDDENLGRVIKDYLTICNFQVQLCNNGELGWNVYKQNVFDLCILDVMLPQRDGFTLAEMIRKENPSVPILFLTAKAAKEDVINGFKIGADDYITKPFNIEELVLRIEVFLKRSQKDSVIQAVQVYQLNEYTFDYLNLSLSHPEAKDENLTQKEADVLQILCHHQGNVVKREEILRQIWGNDDYFAGRSLDVFISKLRKMLKADNNIEIQNVHGVGFKLIVKNG